MENASKALLIAGAILIVLVIIGIAIAFISKTEIFTEMFSDNLSEQEIANHNAIFSIYDGKISGTQLITLLTTAEANNVKSNIKVFVDYHAGAQYYCISNGNLDPAWMGLDVDAGTIISDVQKNRMYEVKLKYNGKGIIDEIEVDMI